MTGDAQPWPTQQELREARMERQAEKADGDERRGRRRGAERGGRRERAEPPETPAPQVPERRPHPSSKNEAQAPQAGAERTTRSRKFA